MTETKTTSFVDADCGFVPLAKPQRLSEQHWPPGTQPWVSIFCITYQHSPFIAQCIEGFLMQETTFPVEILIHDDASSDGTAEIVRTYAEKYPDLISPILQKENQYSKGKKAFRLLREKARGRFIALCEGDDYWSHPRKLERQNKAFEKYPEAVLCGHDVEVVQQGSPTKIIGIRPSDRGKHELVTLSPEAVTPVPPDADTFEMDPIGQDEAMLKKLPQTLSLFFRNIPVYLGPRVNRLVVGDCYFMSQLCVHGGIVYLPETMGVYNVHGGGVYSPNSSLKRSIHLVHCYEAIIRDIAPRWAPTIGVCTAHLCRDTIREALLAREPLVAVRFAGNYLATLLGPLRGLQGGWKMVPRVLKAVFEIAFVPFSYIFGYLPRKMAASANRR